MRALTVTVGLLVPLLISGRGEAFCQATTCDRQVTDCAVDDRGCAGNGYPLWWGTNTVRVAADSRGSALWNVSGDELAEAVSAAVDVWNAAACESGTPPALQLEFIGSVANASLGYDPAGPNVNVVSFIDAAWPYPASNAGRTLLTLDLDTGESLDADIALNASGYAFALEPTDGQVDLIGAVTHELGHVLGLDHSDVVGATMESERSGLAFTELRTLEPDDIAALCSIESTAIDDPSHPTPPTYHSDGTSGSAGSCAVYQRPARSRDVFLAISTLLWLATKRRRARALR